MDEKANSNHTPNKDGQRRYEDPWRTIQIFTKGTQTEGKLAIRLSVREPQDPRGRDGKLNRELYKFQVGVMLHDRETKALGFFQGFRPQLSAYQGRVGLTSAIDELKELVAQAETFVHEEAQRREDLRTDQQISKEQYQANRGKPLTRHTGKTQRKKDKHRQHSNQSG